MTTEIQSFLWTGLSFIAYIICLSAAFFFDRPVNICLLLVALACMFRVVAVAVMEKSSWKVYLFCLFCVVLVAAKMFWVLKLDAIGFALGIAACISGVISFVNAMLYLAHLEKEVIH